MPGDVLSISHGLRLSKPSFARGAFSRLAMYQALLDVLLFVGTLFGTSVTNRVEGYPPYLWNSGFTLSLLGVWRPLS